MVIFGRMTARQRLRRATRESLTIPAFSSPADCTPWVTGGLWPAELSSASGPTIVFQVMFPRSGMYRVWVQFQRHGRVVTAPFTVRVTNRE